MKAVLALVLALLCAPAYADNPAERAMQLRTSLEADWQAGKYPSHAALEAAYQSGYRAITPLNSDGEAYFDFRMAMSLAVDAGEITMDRGNELIREREAQMMADLEASSPMAGAAVEAPAPRPATPPSVTPAPVASTGAHDFLLGLLKVMGAVGAGAAAYQAAMPPPPKPQFPVICHQWNVGVVCQ